MSYTSFVSAKGFVVVSSSIAINEREPLVGYIKLTWGIQGEKGHGCTN